MERSSPTPSTTRPGAWADIRGHLLNAGRWTAYPRPRLVLLALCCLALLVLGAAWRWPTLYVQPRYYLHFASGHLSYSDIVVFYYSRSVWGPTLPYVEQQVEYPVLIGLVLWLTGFAPGREGYFLANAALLIGCLLVCFVLLARTRPPARLALFALAPALAFYVVLNWDALALVWVVTAICLMRGRRFAWAGAALGIGGAAKLFPAFGFPILLAQSLRAPAPDGGGTPDVRNWRQVPWPNALRLAIGFGVATLALNLPFVLLNLRGWLFPYVAQGSRGANIDSVWAGLPAVPNAIATIVFAVAVLAGTLWIAWRVFRGGRWEAGVLLVILLFCLFTKVYSPQYDLWLVPMLALLSCPIWLWLVVVVADAAYYAAIFVFYYVRTGGHIPVFETATMGMLRTTVWGRELMLALLFAWGVAALSGATAGEVKARLRGKLADITARA